jgi:uroporphyrin-III C-methyltransferase/precorrin-2 dehydrogenase/sirohydrochlorin ferrochelatase
MDQLPIFLSLAGRPCLVVGGGAMAARRSRQLLDAGARVTVNAPLICDELAALVAEGRVAHVASTFEPALVRDAFLVIAATDDGAVNASVYAAGEQHGRIVNAVDDPAHSHFIMPAIVERAPVVVAISTGGAAPALARRLRERLEAWLPSRLGRLADVARGWRSTVKARIGGADERRRFWEQVLDGDVAEHVLAGRDAQAQRALGRALNGALPRRRGSVALVGAGPGDADLLTLRALRLLQDADVIVHDRLVSADVLARARRDAELVDAGKAPGTQAMTQDEINATLVRLARDGKRVVRLKGGDPFVFGRGGEELDALRAARIDVEVVPGITAALGCAARAGIPLTHRALAHGLVLVTGHEDPDYASLADARLTVAIYMGAGRLETLTAGLIAHGRARATPAALVENGTIERERVVTGTLGDIARRARAAAIAAPALLFIGKVARYASSPARASQPPRRRVERPAGQPATEQGDAA